MSIRARITLFGLAVVTVVLSFFCALAYGLLVSGAGRDQDRALATRVDQAMAVLPATLPAPQPVPPGATDPRISDDLYVVLLAADRTLVAATGRPPVLAAAILDRADREGLARATVEVEAGVAVRVHVRKISSGYIVSAQTTRQVTTARRNVTILLLVYAVLAFPAGSLAIWLTAGRALRPLVRFAGLADEIGRSGDLGRRVPYTGRARRDALGRLTSSFNGMLDRLQASFTAQQRFTADASHELRTPLTTIRNNAGFLLAHPDAAPVDREAAIRDIAGESERISRLVENLLVLARADAGQKLPRAPVDLTALASDVCRQARGLYPEREITCAETPVPAVPGDADSLVQLMWILIDNAAKYTAAGGHIWVAVTQRGCGAQLHVTDDGPGLPAGSEQRIFDRFYQGDEARGGRGAGLGLAIAAWIVRAHGGTILAANNARGGASFVAEFPISH